MKMALFAAFMLQAILCAGQTPSMRPEIGDPFPYLKLQNVLFQNEPLDLSAYKGKLLIIDFWGLSCYSCLAAVPQLEKLQKLYKDRLQIVMVTKDKREAVENFFKKRKNLIPSLPIVVEDTVLSAMFPSKLLGQHIWADQGQVIYKTGGHNTNPTTLQAYFAGVKLDFTTQDTLIDFDPVQPIWKEGGGRWARHVRYYSMLTGFLVDYQVFSSKIIEDEKGITGVKILNYSLLTLYKMAYGGLRELGELAKANRIVLQVKDTTAFRQDDPLKFDSWVRNNSFCYEALVPPMTEADFCKFMQEDLNRFFPYEATVERRIITTATGKQEMVDMLVIRDKIVK